MTRSLKILRADVEGRTGTENHHENGLPALHWDNSLSHRLEPPYMVATKQAQHKKKAVTI